ncbi:hypothetical protein [Natrialba sp. INN-245]|uniref:helix-turn-helix transcriptional regulator n=1 Tax=Natrialba sp. INN-245 TaxID=2690967 RepID=UPI001312DD0A|nr:hypothetical protein [Natrialba sp. INN-245]MWV41536.1 hypothetical protein [Natrialba sp. INN-245]
MDVRGLRALGVLVVVGCLIAAVPAASSAVVADVGTGSAAFQETADDEQQAADDEIDDGDESPNNETENGDGPTNETDDGDAPVNETDPEEGSDDGLNESAQLDSAEEVHIDVFLHENTSATFVVDYRFENDSTQNWERLRDDVEENSEEYASNEHSDWNDILEEGQNRTDREMEISNVEVETDTSSAPRNLGHVEFTFEWSSFSHVEINRIEAGDALAGFTLVDDTTLQFFWPDGYVVREADPSPDDPPEGSIFWDGDGTEFTDEQPLIVLIENAEGTEEPVEPEESPSMPWLAVAGALALLVAAAAIGWAIRHRADGVSYSPGNGPAQQARVPVESDEPGSQTAGPPDELLSNEERVLRLLEQRGGRIKQQEIVAELDWTEAKTSQVVSGLREDDEVEVFRIGRENVLSLPDDEEVN